MSFTLLASCPDETTMALAQELVSYGVKQPSARYKSVVFETDSLDDFYRVHLQLRTASQLFWVIRECAAKHTTMLTKQTMRVKWSEYFRGDAGYRVDAIQADRGAEFMSGTQISKAVRLGIEQSFAKAGLDKPKVNVKEPKVVVQAFCQKGRCWLSLCTSGKTLHKRGYRVHSHHPAPMKETLAATILALVGYDGTQPLIDAMCGSGTIAIEAAMIAVDKAPLIHRRRGDFGFEFLNNFDARKWRDVQEVQRRVRKEKNAQPIVANDINGRFVEEARENALRARVERYIDFRTGDALKISPTTTPGIIVANLPYGERLEADQHERLKNMYQQFGFHLKHNFSGWKACVVGSENSPYKFIGLKPQRKVRMKNGSIDVVVLVYDLYKPRLN